MNLIYYKTLNYCFEELVAYQFFLESTINEHTDIYQLPGPPDIVLPINQFRCLVWITVRSIVL